MAVPPAGKMKPRPFIALRSMRAQPQDIRIWKERQAAECEARHNFRALDMLPYVLRCCRMC
jgi:hypothetical protein